MDTESLSELISRIPKDAADRLNRHLGNVEKGFSVDLRSPLFGGIDRNQIFNGLIKEVGYLEFDEFKPIEEAAFQEGGPFSLVGTWSEREESVLLYGHQTYSADQSSVNVAIEKMQRLVPFGSLKPWPLDTALGEMPEQTSLGLPNLVKGKSNAGPYFKRAQHVESANELYPAILYRRGTSDGRNASKDRPIWGVDHLDTIKGGTIWYPLLEKLKRVNGHAAWLEDTDVDRAVTRILRRARGLPIISADVSKFDASLPEQGYEVLYEIMAPWYNEEGRKVLRLAIDMARTMGIVVPFKVLVGRTGGLASGCIMTSGFGTLYNRFSAEYVAARKGTSVGDGEWMGDDSIILFSNEVTPSEYSKCLKEIGLTSNPDKQYVSERSVHYLQRWHSLDYQVDGLCVGIRSPFRAINAMMSYEYLKKPWNKWLDRVRWVSQVEQVRNHPRFSDYVKYTLVEGDPEILGAGVPLGYIFKRAGNTSDVRETLGYNAYRYNMQDPSKLENFATAKVLATMV
jgi:hypothetical protein